MLATGSTDISGLSTRYWSQSGDLGTLGLSAEVSGGFSVLVTRVNNGMETVCTTKKNAARGPSISGTSLPAVAGVECLCPLQSWCR